MTEFLELSRKEYIRQQKERRSCHLFGVFPAHYPQEILWAMNVLPVEIWDPPLEVHHANAHLQPYICSVVRLGLELILQGHCNDLDGFLFPHTCDSIQNLASIVYDCLPVNKPCYFFYHPKAPYRKSSRRYFLEHLKGLISRLERQLGRLDHSELKNRVDQRQKIASVLREVYDLRAQRGFSASNAEFYKTIRQGEYLHPDDFLPLLKRFLAASKGQASNGPAVILSGILPSPPEMLVLLDELKVRVAEDDLLNCSRRLIAPSSRSADPFVSIADAYFAMPPCTTKDSPVRDRIDHLLEKAGRTNAKGVIFCMVKFCEPEFFDLPVVTGALKNQGLSTLVIDSDLNQGVSGQLATRLEAFVEMIT